MRDNQAEQIASHFLKQVILNCGEDIDNISTELLAFSFNLPSRKI